MINSVKADKLRIKGQKFLSKGNATRAFLFFEKALLLSNKPADRFNIALALVSLHRFKEAEHYLELLHKEFPENEITSLSFGDCLLMQKKWEKAIEVFTELVRQKPDKKSYQNYLIKAKDPILREKYVLSRELIHQGLAAIDSKQFKEALNIFRKAHINDSENPTILSNLGSLLMKVKNYGEAYSYLTKAVKLEPHNPLIQQNLKKAQNKMKKNQT